MKTLLALMTTLIFSIPSLGAGFKKPILIQGTENLYRSAQPLGKAGMLKQMGISEVVIFKNDTRGEVDREIEELLASGYSEDQIHHIPMEWKDLDLKQACKHTIQALKVLIKAENEGSNALVHCTAGEDRTGMVAGLAQMLLSKTSAQDAFENELCANGYANGNSGKPFKVVADIEEGLTPLYFALAEKIEAGQITAGRLNASICNNLQVSKSQRISCSR